ncbi:MAG: TonB-dependent receptor, partial [Chitinophagaceae bacterium]|nr:TonB-dependent receptor [Chitinophagaceae bacterium]
MRRFYPLIVFIMTGFTATAQTGKITGRVIDESEKPVQSATLSLLLSRDSSVVKFTASDKNGYYEFVDVKEGRYLLSITSVGYAKNSTAPFDVVADKEVQIPSITLLNKATGLTNVTVEAKKPFIETKLDRTVVNVEASPTNAGSTAMDVLEKSPGISVNNDGVISLRGKSGVIVMVDGKPTYLSAADLANMLKNMPASALDQIEIMTNPSSKYDASGNSGVINIKTKKGRNTGFNGSVMVGFSSSLYRSEGKTYMMPKSQNSFNFNYKKNKINFFGNYNPNYFRGRNTLSIERNFYKNEVFDGTSEQITRFKFGNNNHTL